MIRLSSEEDIYSLRRTYPTTYAGLLHNGLPRYAQILKAAGIHSTTKEVSDLVAIASWSTMNLFSGESFSILLKLFYFMVKKVEGFDKVSLLSGKELKVVIPNLPPATMVFKNATDHAVGFGGIVYNELEWLSLKLNFSLDMVVSKDNNLGILTNGTWDGIRGQLQREEVDLACSAFTASSDDTTRELAAYISDDGFGILGQYPIPRTSVYGIFMTFSFNVWIGLIISIIIFIACIYLMIEFKRRFNPPLQSGFKTLTDCFLFIFGTVSNQGGQYRRGHKSIGVIAVTWCFASFVFVNIFSSCLTSYMSLNFQRPDIASFQDLVTNRFYKLITVKSTIPERILKEAKTGTMKEVADKYFECGDKCSMTDYGEIIKKVLNGGVVAVMPLTSCDSFMKKTMVNRTCRLTIGQETIAVPHLYMAVPKKSPFVAELNKGSFLYSSFGFTDYWVKKLARRADQCRLDYNSRGGTVQMIQLAPLKLNQFYLAFLVLFVGYILALFQFVRERMKVHLNHQRTVSV